jgi:hypothetical protein
MSNDTFLFGKRNYILLFSGLALIAVGYFLMAGGGSEDPEVFNPEIFSTTRIRIAPLVVLLGLALQVWAIMLPPKREA